MSSRTRKKGKSGHKAPSLWWLPDWKDASLYPDAVSTQSTQWAWEFLRRNPKYYNLHEALVADFKEQPQLLERASLLVGRRHLDGTFEVPCPSPELQPLCAVLMAFHSLFGLINFPPCPATRRPEIRFEPIRIMRVPEGAASAATNDLLIFKNQLLCIFELEQPLKNQIKYIEGILEAAKKAQRIQDFRMRTNKYKNYLRILDADAQKIPNDEIAAVIFPHIKNSYADGYAGRKRVLESLDSAMELRNTTFRMLALKRG